MGASTSACSRDAAPNGASGAQASGLVLLPSPDDAVGSGASASNATVCGSRGCGAGFCTGPSNGDSSHYQDHVKSFGAAPRGPKQTPAPAQQALSQLMLPPQQHHHHHHHQVVADDKGAAAMSPSGDNGVAALADKVLDAVTVDVAATSSAPIIPPCAMHPADSVTADAVSAAIKLHQGSADKLGGSDGTSPTGPPVAGTGEACENIASQVSMFGGSNVTEASAAANNAAPPPPEGEKEPEIERLEVDEKRERVKSILGTFVVIALWCGVFAAFHWQASAFEAPMCEALLESLPEPPRSCEPCGSGPLFLPLFGEYERSLSYQGRAVLYFIGLLWIFLGVGIVCDQFMGAIEAITSTERIVWIEVRPGAKHKFKIKVWNDTVANLTLMALGSSAPEILLNVVEITANDFFAGELGPSTIVGSAAFNMLVILAVCISAIPAPDIRRIEGVEVFGVTTVCSLLAYVWLVIILSVHSPDRVDVVEGLLTFVYFPVLVCSAFLADKGLLFKLCKRRLAADPRAGELEAKYGKELPPEAMALMIKQQEEREKPAHMTRAQTRATVMRSLIGGKKAKSVDDSNGALFLGFKEANHFVLECAGTLPIKVVANRAPGANLQLNYSTREGTAKAEKRYTHTEGTMKWGPYQLESIIQVPIIDNDVWEENEDFFVELSGLQVDKASTVDAHLKTSKATVTILNDDIPGALAFDAHEIVSSKGTSAHIGINRTRGTKGQITCRFSTFEGSALLDRDFCPTQGVLTFENGESRGTVEIPILENAGFLHDEDLYFTFQLSDASPGVRFDDDIDGTQLTTLCTIIIPANRRKPLQRRLMAKLFNRELFCERLKEWAEQFTGAFYCNGSAEEQAGAGASDWFFHGLSLFWKVLFALVPPPSFIGGWLCFWCALAMIGLVTAIVGDMASLLGCCMGIPDDITAITLVALGTSLPDTFASKVAAQQDETADNSVGNVTGSNSVNVFLGLGLPWSIGSLYWAFAGRSDEWDQHFYRGDTYDKLFSKRYPEGGFMVPAGSLVFSVIVFCGVAFVCIVLLLIRRRVYGGELGGPAGAQRRDSIIAFLLWIAYIVMSVLKSLGSV
eukprot:TRINITY_DN111382_c0_g1_i1.p1 TRINITY_DN111382_c0_g1~~TRINITY_DN111382_c0_g1_i1.p1  ORF type:complete len:1084 (-),score=203.90 TRINITY_DN111382_c0_g1_i1:164-3415(-)